MDESDFEGTLVLEMLADAVDDFFDAVDSDDFKKARLLLQRAGVDVETIRIVMEKMADADGNESA